MRYSVKTLVLLILVPFVVLALFATLAVLVCRRLHPRRLERLHEFDTEQGAIDDLIASNVGDSTLAVRTPTPYLPAYLFSASSPKMSVSLVAFVFIIFCSFNSPNTPPFVA